MTALLRTATGGGSAATMVRATVEYAASRGATDHLTTVMVGRTGAAS